MIKHELKSTLTFILAGGQGERLKPLTLTRAKPAVPFGGCYRIIDFTLSNCIHSGLRRIFVLTQYRARSLEEHIRFGWNFLPRRLEQFIVTRPPQHREESVWYHGTADAIYQNIDSIQAERPAHVLILSGDHVYKMDYDLMLQDHVQREAQVTIGAVHVPLAESRRFGVLEIDDENRVQRFVEKADTAPEAPDRPGYCLASMGIYLFRTEELIRRLQEDAALGNASSHDFGKDVIPRMVDEGRVFVHHFRDVRGGSDPYWRDVGTIEAYFDAHMDLCTPEPQCDLYDTEWPIYTQWHNDPPAKTVSDGSDGRESRLVDSLVCPGVVISGAHVSRSVLSNRVHVEQGASVAETILLRGAQVGRGARLRRVIVDKWTRVPDGCEIGFDHERDRRRFKVTESGIVVVPRMYRFD